MPARRVVILLAVLAVAAGPAHAAAARGALRVGAARVDVTGQPGPSQTGKYDHERLYVRAIVLDNGAARAALVSVESGQFGWSATLNAGAEELVCPV